MHDAIGFLIQRIMKSPHLTIRTLVRLYDDTAGLAVTSELILIATIALIGLVAGSSALRDSVISELSDVAGAVQDLNGCYEINGLTGHSSSVAGMSFGDSTDHCDNSDDQAGVADNCIVFDDPPSNEMPLSEVPPPGDLVAKLNFEDGNASDSSVLGNDNSGIEIGDPNFVGGAVELDGDDAIFISNSSDINIGTHSNRTISLTFNADDVTSTQMLYEEGGTARGLNIYIDNGLLYIGGWNIPAGESGWTPTFISTPIMAGVDYSATLVLDGGTTVQPGALSGYLDGALFGSADGSQLWSHGGGIGIGAANGRTILHSGNSSGSNFFSGTIEDFCTFN